MHFSVECCDLQEEFKELLDNEDAVKALKETKMFGKIEASYNTLDSEFPDHNIKLAR